MALKLKKEVKKSSYYVWFLGAKESKGLRGSEYILPVIGNLEEREKDVEPFKVTLQVSHKGLKIVQNILSHASNISKSGKAKNEIIKHFIPHNTITCVHQKEDIIACILLLFNPVTKCPLHVHAYRCDSLETATLLKGQLQMLIERPDNQKKFSEIESRLVRPPPIKENVSTMKKFDSSLGSDTGTSTRESESSEERFSGDNGRVATLYDSVAAELRAKLNKRDVPILLPPRDYDTVHRQKGNLAGIDTRRCLNTSIVGQNGAKSSNNHSNHHNTTKRIESSGGSSGIGSDHAPSPDQQPDDHHHHNHHHSGHHRHHNNRYHGGLHDGHSTSDDDWNNDHNDASLYLMDSVTTLHHRSPPPPSANQQQQQQRQVSKQHLEEHIRRKLAARYNTHHEPQQQTSSSHHRMIGYQPPDISVEQRFNSFERRYAAAPRHVEKEVEELEFDYYKEQQQRYDNTLKKNRSSSAATSPQRHNNNNNYTASSASSSEIKVSPRDRFKDAKEKFRLLERERFGEERKRYYDDGGVEPPISPVHNDKPYLKRHESVTYAKEFDRRFYDEPDPPIIHRSPHKDAPVERYRHHHSTNTTTTDKYDPKRRSMFNLSDSEHRRNSHEIAKELKRRSYMEQPPSSHTKQFYDYEEEQRPQQQQQPRISKQSSSRGVMYSKSSLDLDQIGTNNGGKYVKNSSGKPTNFRNSYAEPKYRPETKNASSGNGRKYDVLHRTNSSVSNNGRVGIASVHPY